MGVGVQVPPPTPPRTLRFRGGQAPELFVLARVVTDWSHRAVDDCGDHFCGLSLHSRCYVRVGVESDVDGCVAKAFLDDLWMNPRLQSKGCPCVAKVVQTNHGKVVPFDSASEFA